MCVCVFYLLYLIVVDCSDFLSVTGEYKSIMNRKRNIERGESENDIFVTLASMYVDNNNDK